MIEMMKNKKYFLCYKCGFKFWHNAKFNKETCPGCGKKMKRISELYYRMYKENNYE